MTFFLGAFDRLRIAAGLGGSPFFEGIGVMVT